MHSRHLVKLLGSVMLAAISVMAVGASAAQAKYLLLLNGASVEKITLKKEILGSYIKAENGLKVSCTGGSGSGTGTSVESGKKITGTASATLTGCVWVGSEKTCTINDGGAGQIHLSGNGELVMPDANTYSVTISSAELTTILTEGALCTIPEEEVLSGTASCTTDSALEDAKIKLSKLKADNLKLGNSKVTELVGEVHTSDQANPSANFALHLVSL